MSRWPHQEDLFRRGRDGAGLERSHGYGVSSVVNVAVLTKREKASEAVQRANAELRGAISSRIDAELTLQDSKELLTARKSEGQQLNSRHRVSLRHAQSRLSEAKKAERQATRTRTSALMEQRKQQSMPNEIYVRDTALDSVTTCLKMLLLALYEVAPNPRDPAMTAMIAAALDRITNRKLKIGKRRLIARMREPPN